MKLNKNLSKLLMISLSLIAISCAQVPDVYICKEINPDKGYCTKTISNDSRYVDEARPLDGKSWWELRPTMMQVPPSSWKKIKEYIIQQCRLSRNCSSDIGQWIAEIENKTSPFHRIETNGEAFQDQQK